MPPATLTRQISSEIADETVSDGEQSVHCTLIQTVKSDHLLRKTQSKVGGKIVAL